MTGKLVGGLSKSQAQAYVVLEYQVVRPAWGTWLGEVASTGKVCSQKRGGLPSGPWWTAMEAGTD